MKVTFQRDSFFLKTFCGADMAPDAYIGRVSWETVPSSSEGVLFMSSIMWSEGSMLKSRILRLGGSVINFSRARPLLLSLSLSLSPFFSPQHGWEEGLERYVGHEFMWSEGNIHPRSFVGVSQKSIFKRPCQVLAINAHKMAPKPHQRLQNRTWDTPT